MTRKTEAFFMTRKTEVFFLMTSKVEVFSCLGRLKFFHDEED